MDINLIIEIIVKILVALLLALISALTPKIKKWIEEKIGKENLEKTTKYIEEFCAAAEQQLKEVDPDGSKRKAFVIEKLNAIGITSNDTIDAIIEGCVYAINNNKE